VTACDGGGRSVGGDRDAAPRCNGEPRAAPLRAVSKVALGGTNASSPREGSRGDFGRSVTDCPNLSVDLKKSSIIVLCAEKEPTASFSFFCSDVLAGTSLYLPCSPSGRHVVSIFWGPASTMKGLTNSPYLLLLTRGVLAHLLLSWLCRCR
jgi:hypothetical protein